jgi:hypothetical protein
MSKDPKDMEDRPPMGATDDVPPTDRAMLLALSHHQRDSTPLSLDQERLLDSWMADRLPPIERLNLQSTIDLPPNVSLSVGLFQQPTKGRAYQAHWRHES